MNITIITNQDTPDWCAQYHLDTTDVQVVGSVPILVELFYDSCESEIVSIMSVRQMKDLSIISQALL